MNRLLSFVLLAGVLPLAGLYALLMWISVPKIQGGMEPTTTLVCYISLTIIFGALIVITVNFSRQLARQAKGQITPP